MILANIPATPSPWKGEYVEDPENPIDSITDVDELRKLLKAAKGEAAFYKMAAGMAEANERAAMMGQAVNEHTINQLRQQIRNLTP
jgi:hypothetical protein